MAKEPISNRDKKLSPKLGKFWCDTCDGARVGKWQKCPNCGKRSGKKRFKK
jgi:hypothetical protein